jgi:hypothetical protein
MLQHSLDASQMMVQYWDYAAALRDTFQMRRSTAPDLPNGPSPTNMNSPASVRFLQLP